jgi:aminopeptidase YwaD
MFPIRCLVLFVLVSVPGAIGAERGAVAALESITESNLMRHVRFLSDDSLEGRASGSDGNRRAAEYIAGQFREIGLETGGTNESFFQPFEIGLNPELGARCKLVVTTKEGEVLLQLNQDFLPFDHLDHGAGKGRLMFAGYGITAKDEGYDDYAGINVSNKVVLILRKQPREGRKDAVLKSTPSRPNTQAYFTTKLANAEKHGATAVLIVDASAKREDVAEMANGRPRRLGSSEVELPYSFVSYATASNWLAQVGQSLPAVVKGIDEAQQPKSFDLKVSVSLEVEVKRDKAVINNLIGLLPGSDPSLKDEYVVVGGHFDHIGFGNNPTDRGKTERIHNGADDNASGSAAVIELARAFTSLKKRPRRNLLFMAFNAEERGLLGSRHYVNKPTVPLTNIVTMINLDMVGRGASGLDIGGVGTSPGFKPMVDALATNFELKVKTNPGGKAPSDNTSFYNKNIPVLFFYTGKHDDYHKPTDDWQRIDTAEIQSVTRLAYLSADRIANGAERPEFRKSDGNPVRRGRDRILLGIVIEVGGSGPGVRVQSVMPRLPAFKAGIRPGDVLLQFGGGEIKEQGDIARVLQRHKKGDKINGVLKRGDEQVKVVFEL